MKSIVILSFLAFISHCVALPVQTKGTDSPIVGIPIVIEEPTTVGKKQDGTSMLAYWILFGKLINSEDRPDGSVVVEKRNAKEDDQEDDLVTAAGTYALRPLFVYRQQLAYRQRSRDAYRRRNRY